MPRSKTRREYKRLDSEEVTHVHVIEVVTAMENLAEIEALLDNLRQYSSAVVIDRFPVAGGFDANCTILETHAVRD